MKLKKLHQKLKQQDHIHKLFCIVDAARCYSGRTIHEGLIHTVKNLKTQEADEIVEEILKLNAEYQDILKILSTKFELEEKRILQACSIVECSTRLKGIRDNLPIYSALLNALRLYTDSKINKPFIQDIFTTLKCTPEIGMPTFSTIRYHIGYLEKLFDAAQRCEIEP
ncbi:hypothetical protein [Draconibacterium orientale]|uniref:hypothetical protein n=1 Tax=Draconibacterium orientale TaxID=1168034 RepID=UPI002ABD1D61|nr:hypothetical protein [Draconibacterium orientale]